METSTLFTSVSMHILSYSTGLYDGDNLFLHFFLPPYIYSPIIQGCMMDTSSLIIFAFIHTPSYGMRLYDGDKLFVHLLLHIHTVLWYKAQWLRHVLCSVLPSYKNCTMVVGCMMEKGSLNTSASIHRLSYGARLYDCDTFFVHFCLHACIVLWFEAVWLRYVLCSLLPPYKYSSMVRGCVMRHVLCSLLAPYKFTVLCIKTCIFFKRVF